MTTGRINQIDRVCFDSGESSAADGLRSRSPREAVLQTKFADTSTAIENSRSVSRGSRETKHSASAGDTGVHDRERDRRQLGKKSAEAVLSSDETDALFPRERGIACDSLGRPSTCREAPFNETYQAYLCSEIPIR